MMKKLIGFLGSVASTLLMLILVYLGWWKWVWMGLLILISGVIGFAVLLMIVRPQAYVMSPSRRERIIIPLCVIGGLAFLWICVLFL